MNPAPPTHQPQDAQRLAWLEKHGEPAGVFWDHRRQHWIDDQTGEPTTLRAAVDLQSQCAGNADARTQDVSPHANPQK